MILTPGQLYFINEQDVKTGSRSSYYKIGIVRDAEGRDSKNRLLEHQTGNPRKLCIVEALSMPAVEVIETNLHYLFARNRVMGEWMHFSDSELQVAITKAKELATEMQENMADINYAETLKNTISNGAKMAATDEAQELYGVIQDFKAVVEACDETLRQYDQYLYQAIESGVDVSGRATVQNRAGARKFDEKLFATTYPELFKKYSDVTFPVKGSFRVKAASDWSPDLSAISTEQVELLSAFRDLLDTADLSLETGFALHEKHLGVLEIKKYADWKAEMANIKLRVLTADSDGIEGISTWKREAKETVVFDKNRLKSDHPDEYNACMIQGADTTALIVEPKVAQI